MGANTKYYLFSTVSDWMAGGRGYGIKIEKDRLMVDCCPDQNSISRGVYLSLSFDSLEKDTVWHRLRLDNFVPAQANIYLSFFAANEKNITYGDRTWDLDQFISSSQVSWEEKEAFLNKFWIETLVNPTDILLHKAKGRYLWLKIELFSFGPQIPALSKLKIEFPLDTIVRYLPEIYQENPQSYDLLNRFLGIFQSLIYDLDEEIFTSARYFDPDFVDGEFLRWLARWFDIDDYYLWSEEQLRYLIKNAVRLYKIKGTKQSVEEIVTLYTGKPPMIVESFETLEYKHNYDLSRLYQKLYGDNPYIFTVIIDDERMAVPQRYAELKSIINRFQPVHSILNLVILKPYFLLDNYTYLGINSRLSGANNLVLGGSTTIPFDTTLPKTGGSME